MTVLDGGSLRARRLSLGFSQAHLAATLGISANTLARWERGELRIGHPTRVADAIARIEQQRWSERGVAVSHSMRHNLPADVSSFIGREQELGELTLALEGTRLLTLVGPGGVGKTRVGTRLAQRIVDRLPGGAWLVELASVADPALVPHVVASALRVREVPGESVTVTLIEHIAEQQLLLMLDNCEHLVHACAELVHALLSGCPGLRVLATSRQPLRVAGETAWHVPPLATVDASHLFVERARATRVNFEVPPSLEPMLADICQQLDSMPLAIELAAVRARALGLEQIASRLGDRFQLLSRGNEPGPARHRTLRAAMEWSYDLLNSEEQNFFSRLSVFAGGWTLAAAEEVCGEPGSSVLEVLERLVERSLVIVEERSGLVRYSMLETLRQFAAERLAESGAEAQLRERQRAWCCSLAADAARGIWRADQLVWLERLRRERDNIRAALSWTLSGACDPGPGLRLAAAMVRFWNLTGELQEGTEWLTALLALPHVDQQSVSCAQAVTALGYLAIMRGDQPRAIALLDPALAFWRAVGEPPVVAIAVFFRAVATGWYELTGQREFLDLTHEALALARIRGPRWVEYLALLALGEAARMSGDVARAEALLTDGLALAREAGERWGSYLGLVGLGLLALSRGQVQRAGESVREALRMARELDDPRAQAYVLEALASIAVLDRSPVDAVRLFGAAERHRRPLGELMLVSWRADRERGLAAARAGLSQNAFVDAWSAGQMMSLDEAVDFAFQNGRPPRSRAHELTPRELEVLRLAAQGRTNREIGEALVVSHRTVKRHMDNIFAKLTVSSRTAAAAAALRAGLV